MRTVIAIALGVLLSACSSAVGLHPVSPKSELGWSGVSVTTLEALEGDKEEMLDEFSVIPAMTGALEKSFQTAGGDSLRVVITQFRVGWGPARMHAVAEVISAEGAVLKKVDADSTTVRKHIKWKRTRRVAQDIVNKLVQGLGADG